MTTFSGILKGMNAQHDVYAEQSFVHAVVIAYFPSRMQWSDLTNAGKC